MVGVLVARITKVEPHPSSDNPLDIVSVSTRDGVNVANREILTQPRYKIGDYAVVIGSDLLLPEPLLKTMDLWDYEKNKGILSGKALGNRTRPKKIATIESAFALYKVNMSDRAGLDEETGDPITYKELLLRYHGDEKVVTENENVQEFLDIKNYVPQT